MSTPVAVSCEGGTGGVLSAVCGTFLKPTSTLMLGTHRLAARFCGCATLTGLDSFNCVVVVDFQSTTPFSCFRTPWTAMEGRDSDAFKTSETRPSHAHPSRICVHSHKYCISLLSTIGLLHTCRTDTRHNTPHGSSCVVLLHSMVGSMDICWHMTLSMPILQYRYRYVAPRVVPEDVEYSYYLAPVLQY